MILSKINNKETLLFLFTFSLLISLFFSCKKEKPETGSPADPCACAQKVSADFEILEVFPLTDDDVKPTKTDHILGNKNVFFEAHLENATYRWYIGADIETTRKTGRFFPNDLIGQNIPITLVVEKEPNLYCFPDDDGYDSITKIMHVYDRCDTSLTQGTFRVAEPNSTDSIEIILDFETYPQLQECHVLDFYNFNGDGFNCVGYHSVRKNYRAFHGLDTPLYQGGCMSLRADGEMPLGGNNTIIINLSYYISVSGNYTIIKKTYSGRKIN